MTALLTPSELMDWLHSPMVAEAASVVSGGEALFVDLDREPLGTSAVQPQTPVVGVTKDPDRALPDIVDVAVSNGAELEQMADVLNGSPVAATVLVQLLRHNERASVADGLFAESLAYSTLQHAAQFRGWLAARPAPRVRNSDSPAAVVARAGNDIHITLNRPDRHNAFSTAMRDALCDGLYAAVADPATRVVIAGAGRSFCAGGDLDEFGSARDAALAHEVRMTRSAGALIHRLKDRITCRLHGACIGAGIELPAFSAHVTATPDTFFQLPEVAMGLIPGAGGTVSLVKRIGRQRTAYVALSNARIDATTALAWGLIDEIMEH